MSFSVVIPSRSVANLAACVEAIRAAGETCRIIVVDDGVDWNLWACRGLVDDGVDWNLWACRGLVTESAARLGMEIHEGVDPFIWARNINIGIRAAGGDDVVILNDDALLETRGGFTALHQAAQDHPEYGIVSASTNNAGNPAQFRRHGSNALRTCPTPTPGNSFATVAYICVLIPRATINRIGLLDERFGGMTPEGKRIYGYDDNDYSRRLHLVGFKIGIHDGCYVNHNILPSAFRSDPFSMESGLQIYLDKWKSM